MVIVRLYRTGTRGKPSYRIVAIDSRKKRQGRVLDQLGTYEPRSGGTIQLSDAKLAKWLEAGAGLSDTVASLIRRRKRAEASAACAG